MTDVDRTEQLQAEIHAQQDKLERRGRELHRIARLLDPIVKRGEAPNAVVDAWAIAKESR